MGGRLARLVVLTLLMIAVFDLGEIRDAGIARPGDDYACLWAAGRLALTGPADRLYDPAAFLSSVQALVPAYDGACAYFYPPPALLLQVPFSLLPEAPSQWLWLLAGAAVLATAIARLGGGTRGALSGLLHPAVTINLSLGQNGLLSGALVGAALAARSSAASGLALAALCYKPHLAAAAGLCLLVGRRWRALCWAALGGLVLALVSLACFGLAPWQEFLRLNLVSANLLDENMHSFIMQGSVFRSLSMAGAPAAVCLAGQALGVAGGALIAWHAARRVDGDLRVAQTMAALPLMLPHFGTYDLAFLAVPAALLWRRGPPATGLAEVRLILFWIFPLVAQAAAAVGLHVVPLLSLLLVGCCAVESERSAVGDDVGARVRNLG